MRAIALAVALAVSAPVTADNCDRASGTLRALSEAGMRTLFSAGMLADARVKRGASAEGGTEETLHIRYLSEYRSAMERTLDALLILPPPPPRTAELRKSASEQYQRERERIAKQHGERSTDDPEWLTGEHDALMEYLHVLLSTACWE